MALAKNPTMYCMVGTPFTDDGKVDEAAYRLVLRRMVEANNGVYLGSGGAGEGHVLTPKELQRLYEIGVQECKGKVPTAANPREPRSAAAIIEVANLAIKAGVELVQIYPLDGGHGMRPSLQEQESYYRSCFEALKGHPLTISIHAAVGYMAPASLIIKMVNEYKDIQEITFMGPTLAYYQEVMDAVNRKVGSNVGMNQPIQGLLLGATGVMEAESNIAPRTCRRLIDRLLKKDLDGVHETWRDIVRMQAIFSKWSPSTARYVKMGWKVLGLPGGNGYLREPYRLPPQAELDQMSAMFDKMKIRAVEGLPAAKKK